MRDTAIEAACAHLGSAISQAIKSDDQIIMDHVRAAYELLKVVRAGDRKDGAGAGNKINSLRANGFTPSQAFDIAGLRWLGPKAATWEDLEHEINETIHEELTGS